MAAKTEEHDFDAFMSRLPQWAQAHVHQLRRTIEERKRHIEALAAKIGVDAEDATVFLCSNNPMVHDKPLNGGPEAYPGARSWTAVRFGKDASRSYDGIRIMWDRRRNDEGWLDVSSGNGPIEIRAEASNRVLIREASR